MSKCKHEWALNESATPPGAWFKCGKCGVKIRPNELISGLSKENERITEAYNTLRKTAQAVTNDAYKWVPAKDGYYFVEKDLIGDLYDAISGIAEDLSEEGLAANAEI